MSLYVCISLILLCLLPIQFYDGDLTIQCGSIQYQNIMEAMLGSDGFGQVKTADLTHFTKDFLHFPVFFPDGRLKPMKIKWRDYCFRAKIYQADRLVAGLAKLSCTQIHHDLCCTFEATYAVARQ